MDVIVLIGSAIVVIAVGIVALSAVVGVPVIATGINTAIDINENTGGKNYANFNNWCHRHNGRSQRIAAGIRKSAS